jgi:hypothetical protein
MRLRDMIGPRVRDLVGDSPIDWAAGDRARCIEDRGWVTLNGSPPLAGPAYGSVTGVHGVEIVDGVQFLVLIGYPPFNKYSACSFERLEPPREEAKRRAAERFNFRKQLGPAAPGQAEGADRCLA